MVRRSPAPWMPWLLGALTALVLVGVAPQPPFPIAIDLQTAAILIGLVAFIVNVQVPLIGDSISLGYSAGLMTFLIAGRPDSLYETLVVTVIGGAGGGLLRAWWNDVEAGRVFSLNRRLIEWPLMSASQLTLSIGVGGRFYQWLGGQAPIASMTLRDLLPIGALIIASTAIYVAIYALVVWWKGVSPRQVISRNRVALFLTLVVPIPLVITGALIYNPVAPGGFLVLVTGLLALAIWSTEVGRGQIRFQQQYQEMQSLSAVNRAIRTYLDLGAMLEVIFLQAATLLDIQDCTLALYDPNQKLVNFPLVRKRLQRINYAPRELGESVIDYVIKHKAPLLLANRPVAQARGLGLVPPEGMPSSWLGVPLMSSDRALGCIAVSTHEPHRRLNERDQRMLTAIATQASTAIENAQLYRLTQERASQLKRLNGAVSHLTGLLDLARLPELILQSAQDLTSASGVALFLWPEEGQSAPVLRNSLGLSEPFKASIPAPLSVTSGEEMKQSLQAVAVSNVAKDPRTAALAEAVRREKIAAWVELPLRHGKEPLGILVAYFPASRDFSGEEIELLQTFANQAALSISNARLYSRIDQALNRSIAQLTAVSDINQELATAVNVEQVFTLVLDRAVESTRSDHGVLLLRNEAQNKLQIVALRGEHLHDTSKLISQSVVRQASNDAKPAIERQTSGLTQLAVPIVHEQRIIGVILLENRSADAFPPDEVSFIKQLAVQSALTVSNLRMITGIQEGRNRLQVILDSMHEAVIMFELDGRAVLANPQCGALLDLSADQIVAQHWRTLLEHPELNFATRLGFEQTALRALFESLDPDNPPAASRFSYRLERPYSRFIDRTMVPVLDQQHKAMGWLMVFADATEERQLAQAREDLSRMVVHDLRGPLTAISASMKLLTEMVPATDVLGGMVRKTTDASQRAVRKLLGLVNSLLDIAKMESGNMVLEQAPHSLRPLADSVRAELEPLAEELSIRMEVQIPEHLPSLFIDSEKVERVLLNLVDNALKFSPEDGLIQIRARTNGAGHVRVEIIDSGPGIPDDFKTRIFDRFQQLDHTRSHRRGTGLGLTFCRLTVESHGGRIWIEDNPTGGSIFAFTLPTILTASPFVTDSD